MLWLPLCVIRELLCHLRRLPLHDTVTGQFRIATLVLIRSSCSPAQEAKGTEYAAKSVLLRIAAPAAVARSNCFRAILTSLPFPF